MMGAKAMLDRQGRASDIALQKWGTYYKNSKERTAFYEGYSAACQDEAEAVRGLVEALEKCRDFIVLHDDEGLVAHSDLIQNADRQLKAWKGE